MADPPPYPGTPRWAKMFGILIGVLFLLVAIMLFAGGHGPGRHTPPGDAGRHASPEGGHR